MASTGGFSSLVFLSLAIVFLFSSRTLAQTPSAPAPAPSGPVNLTGILEKGGQFTTFIRLLNTTQVDRQLINQLNSSTEGMTVFAPTDNAFNSLPSGAINDLSPQEKVQLVLYHITSKYYSLSDLLLVSNPVRTLASGEDGNWGLNFTGQGNQLNVSTGVVETQLNNALRQQFPLAVYQVEKVLLPEQLFGAKTPSATPTPKTSPSGASNTTESSADQPAPADSDAGARSMGLGLVTGLAVLFCMEVFS